MYKFMVFKGRSQYNVLSLGSEGIVSGAQELGHTALTIDMSLIDSQHYLSIVDDFKPDFTIGLNPTCYYYEDKMLHYNKTKVPHLILLGDSPHYHVYNRSLDNPNDALVHSIVFEKPYIQDFLDYGVQNVSFKKLISSAPSYKINFENKIYPLVFFGTFIEEQKILFEIENLSLDKQFKKTLVELISEIHYFIETNLTILPDRLSTYIREYVKISLSINNKEIENKLVKLYFPFVDKYYNSLIRRKVLTSFAEVGIPMIVFGSNDTEKLLAKYPNVKVKQPVHYIEHFSIIAHSKINLNITPTKFSMHERIPNTLMNSTLLCTNLMPNLFENYPEILDSSIIYNLDNLQETAKLLKEIMDNKEMYNEIVFRGLDLAKREFTFEKEMDFIIKAFEGKYK